MSYIGEDKDDITVWKFRRISGHEGPLHQHHPNYKGSKYNVMVEWETGEITSEPLDIIAKDDPVTCAIYAKDNNLLEISGWKRFKGIAKRHKKFIRIINQAKLRSFRTAPRYKYGYELPRNGDYEHAKALDERNGNTKWQDALHTERTQLFEYNTFKPLPRGSKAPKGHKKIRVHVVWDVKHDGRHKARIVAGGHLTDEPVDSVYSGVVSLRGIRLMIFLAELNNIDLWTTDIGNAYLEALTKEKVYIVAGSEFGEYEGQILIIHKALYGLRSSGLRWWERLAACLRKMGFSPCKGINDIWIRRVDDQYEYIAVYVDDLAIASKDPKAIIELLEKGFMFKLKGTGPISFHLGCDFFRDGDETLCMAPRRYIEKMIDSYERMFGNKPNSKFYSPLERNDHPEMDTSEFLDVKERRQYQSLIGSLQWAISIGRFDIAVAVMTLSSFRELPRRGHMDRAKRVVGYLSKMKDAAIRFRTEAPDYADLEDRIYDWSESIYGDVKELIPNDAPEPLGKPVTLTHYFDANLYHDQVTGRSVTATLHLVNKTPIDWFAKKQATVETATYGSEFIAGRICVDQVVDLRTSLRYLGVPILKSYMFGDNKSMVDLGAIPDGKLHKRHHALSYHRVREAVASKIIDLHHIPGSDNPADILSKHWGYQQIWHLLKPLLFWSGNTDALLKDD